VESAQCREEIAAAGGGTLALDQAVDYALSS